MGKELFEVPVEDADRPAKGRGHRSSRQEHSPTWFEESLIELGEEVGQAQAEGGDKIAVCARDADDEAPAAQPSQVVCHLVGSVGVSEERLDEAAQVPMAEAMDLKPIVAERCQQGHDARIAEAQSRDAIAVGEQGSLETREIFAVALTAVGETLAASRRRLAPWPMVLSCQKFGRALPTPKSAGSLTVVSVRRAWPSLKYCLTWQCLYSTWRLGSTPSVITRVR